MRHIFLTRISRKTKYEEDKFFVKVFTYLIDIGSNENVENYVEKLVKKHQESEDDIMSTQIGHICSDYNIGYIKSNEGDKDETIVQNME